jgi:hypothetical protein
VKNELGFRAQHRQVAVTDGLYTLREPVWPYSHHFDRENEALRPNNTVPCKQNLRQQRPGLLRPQRQPQCPLYNCMAGADRLADFVGEFCFRKSAVGLTQHYLASISAQRGIYLGVFPAAERYWRWACHQILLGWELRANNLSWFARSSLLCFAATQFRERRQRLCGGSLL